MGKKLSNQQNQTKNSGSGVPSPPLLKEILQNFQNAINGVLSIEMDSGYNMDSIHTMGDTHTMDRIPSINLELFQNYFNSLCNENKKKIIYFLLENKYGCYGLLHRLFDIEYKTIQSVLFQLKKGGIITEIENEEAIEIKPLMQSEWHFKNANFYKLNSLANTFYEGIEWEKLLPSSIIRGVKDFKLQVLKEKEKIKTQKPRKNLGIKNKKIEEAYWILYDWCKEKEKWTWGIENVISKLQKEMGVKKRNTIQGYLADMGKLYHLIDARVGWIIIKKIDEVLGEKGGENE